VGQLVGAQRPRAARKAAITGYLFGTFFSSLIATLLLIYRYDIPLIFTNDVEVSSLRSWSLSPFI
jgi:Na+-driven multidrug efflux pump